MRVKSVILSILDHIFSESSSRVDRECGASVEKISRFDVLFGPLKRRRYNQIMRISLVSLIFLSFSALAGAPNIMGVAEHHEHQIYRDAFNEILRDQPQIDCVFL